ncbi:ADP-ribosylation factor-like protein 2 [Oppia nitens]|uniref:ADP-ribosylation factor-like protein 2 n=1 Tax=Oppia nitens TaxID=1686743 RepID=UPI0023DB1893|nr:ADP-ribosylation factor-like protein 2 [Oppia nitens]
MGLLKIIRKIKQKEKEVRLLVLGLDNSGKTTILKKLNGEDVHTISPTLGFTISSFEHKNLKLNVWDVGGQKSLRAFWRNYFEATDGLIFVVDSSDTLRLNDAKEELKNLLQEERLLGATLLVLANKQDLSGALNCQTICELLEVDSIKTHHWKIVGSSAYTGLNLLSAIDWLLDDIASRIFISD